MSLYYLPDKTALRFYPEAARFLKEYTTNSADKPASAFVDIQGRVIALVYQRFLNEDEAVLVLEKKFEERLKQHLKKFLPLFKTVMEPLEKRIYHDVEGNHVSKPGEISIPQKKGQLLITSENYPSDLNDAEYTLFRLKNAIPVQGEDFDQTLLLNVGSEEFVSYEKGCYLGQEIIARVHYKGKPPKALVVKAEDECTPAERSNMTSKAKDPATGKTLGFVFLDC